MMPRLLPACLLTITLLVPGAAYAADSFHWEQVPLRTKIQANNGLPGGEGFQKIMAIEFALSDPEVVYMATDQSQVWRSDDSGKNWYRRNGGFYAHGARSVGVDPINSDVVVAAASVGKKYKKGKTLSNKHQGIYLTTDGGKNWSLKRETDFFKQVSKGSLVAYIQSQDDTRRTSKIVVGSYSEGLLISDDAGETWQVSGLLADEKILDIEVSSINAEKILIATEQGLYTVENNSLKKTGRGLPDYPRNLAINNKVAGTVYAATGSHGIYISRDDGESFTPSGSGLPIGAGLPFATDFTEIEASTTNGNIVYAKAHNSRNKSVYYSHNAGADWQAAKSINQDRLMPTHAGGYFSGSIATSPTDENLALFAANGQDNILVTKDAGVSWLYSGNGYSGGRMKDIEFIDKNRMILSLTDFGLWETNDAGSTFRQLPVGRLFGLSSSDAVAVSSGNIIASLGAWHKMGLAISHDNGENWRLDGSTPGRITLIESSGDTVYAGNQVSNDNGRTWKKIKYTIRSVHPVNGNTVYAINEYEKKNANVMRSTDKGMTWTTATAPVTLNNRSIRGMAVTGGRSERIYLASVKGIHVHENNKWILINHKQGLDKDYFGLTSVYCLAVDPDNHDRIFAGKWAPGVGRSNGVYMTEDGGKSWSNISNSLMKELSVYSIKIDSTNKDIYIGTSHGTFKSSYKQEINKDA